MPPPALPAPAPPAAPAPPPMPVWAKTWVRADRLSRSAVRNTHSTTKLTTGLIILCLLVLRFFTRLAFYEGATLGGPGSSRALASQSRQILTPGLESRDSRSRSLHQPRRKRARKHRVIR